MKLPLLIIACFFFFFFFWTCYSCSLQLVSIPSARVTFPIIKWWKPNSIWWQLPEFAHYFGIKAVKGLLRSCQWDINTEDLKSHLNVPIGSSLIADCFSRTVWINKLSIWIVVGNKWPELGEYLAGSSSPWQRPSSNHINGVRCRNFAVSLFF